MFDLTPPTKTHRPLGEDGPEFEIRGLLAGEANILREFNDPKKDKTDATYRLLSRCIVDMRGVSLAGTEVVWQKETPSGRLKLIDLFPFEWVNEISTMIMGMSTLTKEDESSSSEC